MMSVNGRNPEAILKALRAELQAQSEQTEDDRRPVQLDQQAVGRLSRMDAMQVQAMAEAQQRQRAIKLQQIDAALQRLEDDEYGFCITCGEAVDPRRLSIDPTATLCISCAKLNEQ